MKSRLLSILLCGMFVIPAGGLLAAGPMESPALKERPRIYRGPYKEDLLHSRYFPSLFLGYGGFHAPFFSPLSFMGYVPPGRSMVTFAVGSDGYRGTSFSTSDWIEGTRLLYSLSASWEKGETWYSGQDFERTTISPGLSWSNGTTSLFFGVDLTEVSFDTTPVTAREQPRVDPGPLSSQAFLHNEPHPSLELESVHLGLSQQIGDNTFISLSVGQNDFDRDGFGAGMDFAKPAWHRSNGHHLR